VTIEGLCSIGFGGNTETSITSAVLVISLYFYSISIKAFQIQVLQSIYGGLS
jgi:hypothetical protein